MNPNSDISLGILAAGSGQRWGGRDKGLIAVRGRLLIDEIIGAFKQDVAEVIINCRRNPYVYGQYSSRLIGDAIADAGPTAGIAALLACCQGPLLLVLPCDLLEPSKQLVARMVSQLGVSDSGVVLIDETGRHSACVLLRVSVADAVWSYIQAGGRSLAGLFETLSLRPVLHAAIVDVDEPSVLAEYRRSRRGSRPEQSIKFEG